MGSRKFGSKIIVRCDRMDEIIDTIKIVCSKYNVKLASVTGIGAVNKVTIGIFKPDEKEYHSIEISKDMEISSLIGNISRMNEEIYLHAHITLTDHLYNAFGGHLNFARVSCTAELIIDVIDGEVGRCFNQEIGLNLLDF